MGFNSGFKGLRIGDILLSLNVINKICNYAICKKASLVKLKLDTRKFLDNMSVYWHMTLLHII